MVRRNQTAPHRLVASPHCSAKEIDASIAAKAEFEYLYDKPYTDNKKVRVAGPFTVESLSPHRILGVNEHDELIDPAANPNAHSEKQTFPHMILENLKTAGVQQAHKEDKITFTAITPWPGDLVCADGRYNEGNEETGTEKRAAIFISPEFGTVLRADLVEAAREAGEADFDVLIRLGRLALKKGLKPSILLVRPKISNA
jgi:adenine-specific DNA-methyltransferase